MSLQLPEIGIRPQSQILYPGSKLELRCEISNPEYTVTWLKDGSILNDQTGNELQIKSAGIDDSGTYQCSGHDGKYGIISNSANIQIIGKRQILYFRVTGISKNINPASPLGF